jgi:hypothetical protein
MAKRLNPIPATLVALALAFPAAGAVDKPNPNPNDCFLSNSWQGWTAPGEGDVLYLRVGLHDIYRADLTPGSHARKVGDNFLVNRIHGSSWICSALDLDLTLSDHHGFSQAIIVRSLRKLTPVEVAAIPKKDLP